jgi:hypothetical protein
MSGKVTLSSTAPSARPVVVTMKLSYEMQCGWPGNGEILVTFPHAMKLDRPALRSRGAVLIDGKAATEVAAPDDRGGTVLVSLPPRPHIMCDAIGPGIVTLTFTKKANLGNPAAAGGYTVSAKRTSVSAAKPFSLRFSIA